MITINDLNKKRELLLNGRSLRNRGGRYGVTYRRENSGYHGKTAYTYVFKGSYRKANRSRLDSFTGIGDEKALKILRKVSETFDIPTVTDIHETTEAAMRRICRRPSNPGFPMPPNGFIGSGGRDREDRQYKERTVPFAGCHAIRRTKGSGRRK